MSNADPAHIDRIEFDPETDSPADTVDAMLKSIRTGLVETVIEACNDDPEASLRAAAVAIEVDNRIRDGTELDLPPHLDPTDAFEDNVVEGIADDVLQDYADDLHASVARFSGDDREHLLEIIGELDSRIGGGARC